MDLIDRPADVEAPATPPVPARRPRARALVAGGLCVGAIVFLLVGGLSENIVYFRTVSEAVTEHADDDGRFRMAGAVVAGSVARDGETVTFTLHEGGENARVAHRGDPPELFGDDAPVVVEGRWGPDGAFRS
ncbi:MAG: cytochrome c maturation protein CcmE, partial [Acidimicrobiia bacterium]